MSIITPQTTNWTAPKIEFFDKGILSKRVFILISGKAGVGKTTFTEYLIREFDNKIFSAIRRSIAGELKRFAREYFNWNGEKDLKGRALLQGLGNLGREYDENVWIRNLLNDIDDYNMFADFVIIDDWRFPNECEYLKNNNQNVITVRILSKERRGLEGGLEEDLTETSLKDDDLIYDIRIHNDKSFED